MAATDTSGLPNPEQGSAISWIAAWLLILVMLIGLSKARWGKPIVYYTLWLVIIYLVVTHYKDYVAIATQQGGL